MSRTTKIALCMFFITSLNLYYVVQTISRSVSPQSEVYTYRGHDYPETLPDVDTESTPVWLTVEESVHFLLLGQESDSEWNSPTSAGYGYVRLGPESRTFAITMFHELHCLRILNLAFGRHPIASPAHVRHCLSYLRQGVLCLPDLTLEPGNFEERGFEPGETGATHVCRDWSAVYPVADENYMLWMNATL